MRSRSLLIRRPTPIDADIKKPRSPTRGPLCLSERYTLREWDSEGIFVRRYTQMDADKETRCLSFRVAENLGGRDDLRRSTPPPENCLFDLRDSALICGRISLMRRPRIVARGCLENPR
ncbi:hypothetical protein [Salinisphaera hydrothermalis]|uniref:hypothetical protein n=1 Tax=Salinisphaera hydrothermalis TaxID=563188 RepID=UPI0012EB11CC|nr:hypothetical protein [Salinisphaera hydrothermalis]